MLPSVTKSRICGAIFDAPTLRTQLADIETKIGDPSVWTDQEKSQQLMRQRKRLESSLAMDTDLARRVDDIAAYFDLAREGESVTGELKKEIDGLREISEKLETQTLLSGENDIRNAIVTIHPGAGGTESQDWAEMLLRMYLRWAERQGFSTEVNEYQTAEEAGIKSEDIRIDTYRSGGKGGQHVNTTDSAVRITHIPTNLVVACQNERSQHKNRERAFKMLRSKLYEYELEKKKAASQKVEDSKLGIDFGSQIRSYVLAPYRMIKDHRTKVEIGDVDRVLDGDLKPFIRAYLLAKRDLGEDGAGAAATK